jgi:hypothetical protein
MLDFEPPVDFTPSIDWNIGSTGFNWIPNLGDLNWGGGGAGGFNFGNLLSNIGTGVGVGKDILGGVLSVRSQMANAQYQRDLQNYYRQQAAQQAAYNTSVQNYLNSRAAWEQQMAGTFQDTFNQFGDQLKGFQDTMGGIVQQELAAAQPLLQQSQSLIQPAIAALAKGEVPPVLQPVLDQARARARAAAQQQFAAAGNTSGMAASEQEIDATVQKMLITAAQAMLQSGQTLGQEGLQFLTGAAGTEQASIGPLAAEVQALMQAMSGLFGGFPGLTSTPPPPAPVA